MGGTWISQSGEPITPRIGVADIDAQHDTLHQIVSDLVWALAQDLTDTATELLAELVNAAKEHFSQEEQHMERHGYPQLGEHAKEHAHLMNALESTARRLRTDAPSVDTSVVGLLWEWLNQHVATSDREYADYVINAGL